MVSQVFFRAWHRSSIQRAENTTTSHVFAAFDKHIREGRRFAAIGLEDLGNCSLRKSDVCFFSM